jgi:RNA polymerase sigma-70 factor (ECF subfamily)
MLREVGMPPPDRLLAQRMLAGDETAFSEFFQGNFPGLYRFAMARMNRDPDAAEEVAQTTLCTAISKLRTYRGEAALFTWLCTFCRHEISAYYKRRSRQPVSEALLEDDPEVASALDSLAVSAGDAPDEALRRSEIARLVHATLDRLPSRYADALEWKYVDGSSVGEIAARLGLTAKAAESLLTRARVAFRDGFSTLVHQRAARPVLAR